MSPEPQFAKIHHQQGPPSWCRWPLPKGSNAVWCDTCLEWHTPRPVADISLVPQAVRLRSVGL